MSNRLPPPEERLAAAVEQLSLALCDLPARAKRDARWRLSALEWNLVGALNVAFVLAQIAAERFEDAGSQPWPSDESQMGAHLLREFADARDAANVSRFTMEGALRSLHSSGDLMAQLIRASLLPCQSEYCMLSTMMNPARQCSCSIDESRFSSLTAALTAYRDSPQYRYVAAATNRLKHRNLIGRHMSARRHPDTGIVTIDQILRGFSHDGRRVCAASLCDLRWRSDRLRLLACSVVGEIALLVEGAVPSGGVAKC